MRTDVFGESNAILNPEGQPLRGIPRSFASRVITQNDDEGVFICSGSPTATVNLDLYPGFGCSFKGAVTFTGAATITDLRSTGAASPWCSLVNTGTGTYDVVGTKA
jgi:hypothetical protein